MIASKPTVHLIYPHGNRISCPDAIGRNIRLRLEQTHRVVCYELNHPRAIVPAPGDILLGHPDSSLWSVFNRSLDHPHWAKRIAIMPFVTDDLAQCAFADPIIARCDAILGICGRFWARRLPHSRFRHWLPRFSQLDLAINQDDFPALKPRFNPPGQRRLAYIGNASWYKNLGYLDAIAEHSGQPITWLGCKRNRLPHLTAGGFLDFSTPEAKAHIASFDGVIVASSADANPTVILEAMSWGLIPICTPQCGYDDEPGIINFPLNNVPAACSAIAHFQTVPEDELLRLQQVNRARLSEHYTWERFTSQVLAAITDHKPAPPLPPTAWTERAVIRWSECTSPRSWMRWHALSRALRRRFLGQRK